MRRAGNKIADFLGVPNQPLDQFTHALWGYVPWLVLAVLGAGLLGFAFKWMENRLVRFFRDKKQRALRGK